MDRSCELGGLPIVAQSLETSVILIVCRSTNAAIDALAIPVLDETDLRRDVNPQREQLMLR